MSTLVERLSHECGSEKGLQVFLNEDGKYTGYCFSCDTFVPNPYKDRPNDYKPKAIGKTPEEVQAEIEEIQTYKTVDLTDRKLKKEYLEYFGVKIGLSEADGSTPVTHYYPYYKGNKLQGYKVRLIEGKRIWSLGSLKEVDLFGWQQALETGAKKLIITEGELDAVALFQICKQVNKGTQYADLNPAIVSIPKGAAGAARDLASRAAEIKRHFKEIILCFDQDDAGKHAVEETLKLLPEAKVAILPSKDANDCLKEGRLKAAYAAIQFKAEKPKNTRLVSLASVVEAAKKPVEWGYSYPYKKLTELTRGRRFGETYYLGAGVKMGKSEVLNDMVAWDIKEHGWKVFVVKPEETNVRTVQGVVGKIVNKIFHDPAIPFDYEAFDKGIATIGDKLTMLNIYQEMTWEVIKSDIRAAIAEGCKSVYIDPITNFTNGINAAEANTILQQIAQESGQIAMDSQIMIHFFCHLKAPDNGPSHERGGQVLSTQFAGSRGMMRSCNSMIGIEGDKDPDLPREQRNLRTLVLLEDRATGNSGKVPLYWDAATGAFNEL